MASKRKTTQRRPAAGSRNRQAAQRQAQQRRTVIGIVLASLAVLAVIVGVVLSRGGDDDAPQVASVANVTPAQAHTLMDTHQADQGWVVLDVRTAAEFTEAHLARATNIDFNASDFRSKVNALDHDRTYVVYCHTGNRSGKATAVMHDLGFSHVYNVTGGIAAWQQAGLPTTA